jgi:hypothetical protein
MSPVLVKRAPRSEVKTNEDLGSCSRRSRRSARSSSLRIGCVLGVPSLTLRTCRLAVPPAHRSCRKATTIMVAYRWPFGAPPAGGLFACRHALPALRQCRPYGKTHLVLTRGTAIDANVCIASVWQLLYAGDFHLLSAPACWPFGTTGF